jgi:hypothetical protein
VNQLINAYPILIVLAGFAASGLLYRRGVALMSADAKAALVDATSRTNLLVLLVIAVFVALLFWRPLLGWIFLGCAYLGLGVRSVFRLRQLQLPTRAARLVLVGNWAGIAGIVLCALIFAQRALT